MSAAISPASSSSLLLEPCPNKPFRSDFDTLIELLDPEIKESTINSINSLKDKAQKIAEVYDLAISRDYIYYKSLFTHHTFVYYALASVQERVITAVQFATLMRVRAVLEENIPVEALRVIPLFIGDEYNEEAWDAIYQTLKSPRHPNPIASPQEFINFFENARSLPLSERYFVTFRYKLLKKPNLPPKKQIFTVLRYRVGYNLFGLTRVQKQRVRMIPSLGMHQAFIDATNGNGLKAKPRIGVSTTESIKTSILYDDAREICVHCPGIARAPKEADGYVTSPMDFDFHDGYHFWIASRIPKPDRIFYCHYSDAILSKNPLDNPMYEIANKINGFIVDAEFVRYWNRDEKRSITVDDSRERTMYRILEYLRACYNNPETCFEDEEAAKKSFADLEQLILGIYGIWNLFKQNYTDFSEVTDTLDEIEPHTRHSFSQHVKQIVTYNNFWFRAMIPTEDLRSLPLEHLSEVAELTRQVKWDSFRKYVKKGGSFREIWALPPDKRLEPFQNDIVPKK